MPTRQNWFDGWRLFALLSLTLLALSIWIAGMREFEVDGVRMVIRFTARTSLLFFCLAFSAAALARLWPNAWTQDVARQSLSRVDRWIVATDRGEAATAEQLLRVIDFPTTRKYIADITARQRFYEQAGSATAASSR